MVKQNKNEGGIRHLFLPTLFGTKRTRQVLNQNPNTIPIREDSKEIKISVHDYNDKEYFVKELSTLEECFPFFHTNTITWINIDGIRKKDVEAICNYIGIHPLIQEDILSINQRPKMEEVNGVLFCLLNMLYYNGGRHLVEQEQVSIVFLKKFVLSFQEDATRDVFTSLREKLKIASGRIRQSGADHLCSAMLDLIVDHYFVVMDQLGDRIELLEEEVVRNSNKRSLAKINLLRKELIVLKRNMAPVRDLVNGFIRSDSELLSDVSIKYFKDVHDHIIQAHDLSETYRDMTTSLQELYISNVNLRLNEIMKWLAIVTSVLAPAMAIGGIFGMNFVVVPEAYERLAFWLSVSSMFLIPTLMLFYFKKNKWL